MRIIGVTGRVGSGKSELLKAIENGQVFPSEGGGCCVVRADEVARMLQEPGGACYDSVRLILGDECVDESGFFDRDAVREKIFSHPALLERVNATVHPAVREYILDRIESERKRGCSFFFIEAALLLETGYGDICDELWYIYVDDEERKRRLKFSRGYSAEQTERILAKQLSDRAFREGCDVVIDNSGSIESALTQVKEAILRTDRT